MQTFVPVEPRAASYAIPPKEEFLAICASAERVLERERQSRHIEGDLYRSVYAASSVIEEAVTNQLPLLKGEFSAELGFTSRMNDGTYYTLSAKEVSGALGLQQGRLRTFMAGYIRDPAIEPKIDQGRPGILEPDPPLIQRQIGFLTGKPVANGAKLLQVPGPQCMTTWSFPVYAGRSMNGLPKGGPRPGAEKSRLLVREEAKAETSRQAMALLDQAAEANLPSLAALAQAIFDRLVELAPLDLSVRHERLSRRPKDLRCRATFSDSGLVVELADSPRVVVPWSQVLSRDPQHPQISQPPFDTLLGGSVIAPWRGSYDLELAKYFPSLPQGFQPHSNVAWSLAWTLHERLRREWYLMVPSRASGIRQAERTLRELKASAQDETLRAITGTPERAAVPTQIGEELLEQLKALREVIEPSAGAMAASFMYLWLMADNSIAYRLDLSTEVAAIPAYLKGVVELKNPLVSVSGWVRNAEGQAGTTEEIQAFAARSGGTRLVAEYPSGDLEIHGIVQATFGLLLKRVKKAKTIKKLGGSSHD